jgi:hypothetical protein
MTSLDDIDRVAHDAITAAQETGTIPYLDSTICVCVTPVLTARTRELEAMLSELRSRTARDAEHTMYGFFPGGDPRLFTPDFECVTPEEMAQWKEDCAAWERGEQKPVEPQCTMARDGIRRSGYGPGVYTIVDDELVALVARIDAVLKGGE